MGVKCLLDVLTSATDKAIDALKGPARKKMLHGAADRVVRKFETIKTKSEIRAVEIERELASCEDEDEATKLFEELAENELRADEAREVADIVKAREKRLFAAPTEDELEALSLPPEQGKKK